MAKGDDDLEVLSRREALEKLAKLSAYTAPAVTTLLTPKLSYAMGSGIPGTPTDNPAECLQWGNGAHNELGADNGANEIQGDVTNTNAYPRYANHPEHHDWWHGANSDHALYWQSRHNDSSSDCGS